MRPLLAGIVLPALLAIGQCSGEAAPAKRNDVVTRIDVAGDGVAVDKHVGNVTITFSGGGSVSYVDNTTTITAPDLQSTKSRGSLGSPTAVTASDYVMTYSARAYSGTQYLTTGRTGFMVSPGSTITSANVPTDWYVDLRQTGVLSDPKGSAARLAMRIIPHRLTGYVAGTGVMAFNFPASWTLENFSINPPSVETSTLNVYAPANASQNSGALSLWREDSAGTAVLTGTLGWAFTDTTHGSHSTYFAVINMRNGAVLNRSFVVDTTAQATSGRAKADAWSFLANNSLEIRQAIGAGSDYDLGIYSGQSPTTLKMLLAGDAGGGNFLRVYSGGTGSAGITLGPANNTNGWYYDQDVGGLYSKNDYGSTQIGRPGYMATNSTKEFLGLPTAQGAVSSTPGYMSTGKTPVYYNENADKLCAYNRAASAWRCSAAFTP